MGRDEGPTGEDDEGQVPCQRVAEWLKAELEDRLIKKIMREHKVNREFAKRALERIRAQEEQGK